jgi:hypothetical protein
MMLYVECIFLLHFFIGCLMGLKLVHLFVLHKLFENMDVFVDSWASSRALGMQDTTEEYCIDKMLSFLVN